MYRHKYHCLLRKLPGAWRWKRLKLLRLQHLPEGVSFSKIVHLRNHFDFHHQQALCLSEKEYKEEEEEEEEEEKEEDDEKTKEKKTKMG